MAYVPTPPNITLIDIQNLNAAIQAVITMIMNLNNTGVALTIDERKAGVTVGKQRKPFTDYYFTNKNNHPALKPTAQKVTEAQADAHYATHTELNQTMGLIGTLAEVAGDIQLNGEHFSYDFAVGGLTVVDEGARNGVPGADSFRTALRALFPNLGPKPNNP